MLANRWVYEKQDFNSVRNGVAPVDYQYDEASQLVGADYNFSLDAAVEDETYQYDANGNRTDGDNLPGAHNRPQEDDNYFYTYDAEGNRTQRTSKEDGSYDDYTWDARNRLIAMQRHTELDVLVWTLDYQYDHLNRLVGRIKTPANSSPQAEQYVYDGDQIILRLDDDHEILNRYLWGPMVDQLLADESAIYDQYGDVSDHAVLWTLGDHQNSNRDLVEFNGTNASVVNHRVYDSFGSQVSSTSTIDTLFDWTGRYYDPDADHYNNLNRWHPAGENQFLNEDLIGFGAGDPNTRRYTGNDPINLVDPSGLVNFSYNSQWSWWRKASAIAGLGAGTIADTIGELLDRKEMSEAARYEFRHGPDRPHLADYEGRISETINELILNPPRRGGMEAIAEPIIIGGFRTLQHISKSVEESLYQGKSEPSQENRVLKKQLIYAANVGVNTSPFVVSSNFNSEVDALTMRLAWGERALLCDQGMILDRSTLSGQHRNFPLMLTELVNGLSDKDPEAAKCGHQSAIFWEFSCSLLLATGPEFSSALSKRAVTSPVIQTSRTVLNSESVAALRAAGLNDAAIAHNLEVLGDIHLFRGTTEGFAGNPALLKLGLTPTTVDPVVATAFAAEGATMGVNPIILYGPRSAFSETLGMGNVRSLLEREVSIGLTPSQFAARAPRSVSLARSRTILSEMGIVEVPPTMNNADNFIRHSPRMTPEQIKQFIERASK